MLHRNDERGFTLIELMVAMSAGMIVSLGAFLMARNASAFFQNEARLGSTQFASMIGMTRLQNDLRRAAMESSPNATLDPMVCGYSVGWPSNLRALSGIQITEGGSVSNGSPGHGAALNLSVANGLNPDSIIIDGMMTSTEHYSVAALQSAGGGSYTVYLELDGAYYRAKASAQAGQPVLGNVFRVGDFIRVVDQEGKATFSIITGYNETGLKPQISTSGTPALQTRQTNGTCGCTGICTGGLANPVNSVLYDIRAVDPGNYPRYASMFNNADVQGVGKPSFFRGDPVPQRTELVRVDLDADGNERGDTLEIVAEYAVDLKFGLTRTDPGGPPNFTPVVTRYAIGDKNVYNQAKSPAAGGHPEHVSAVQVRMSVRAPYADREAGLANVAPNVPDNPIFRFNLDPNNKTSHQTWARMRTLITEVFLSNQAGIPW